MVDSTFGVSMNVRQCCKTLWIKAQYKCSLFIYIYSVFIFSTRVNPAPGFVGLANVAVHKRADDEFESLSVLSTRINTQCYSAAWINMPLSAAMDHG